MNGAESESTVVGRMLRTVGFGLQEAWYLVTGYTLEKQMAEQRAELRQAKRRVARDCDEAQRAALENRAKCKVAVARNQGHAMAMQHARSAVAATQRQQTLLQAKRELEQIEAELSRVGADMSADVALRNITALLERFGFKYGGTQGDTIRSYSREATKQLVKRDLRHDGLEIVAEQVADSLDSGADDAEAQEMVNGFCDAADMVQAEQLSAAMVDVRLRRTADATLVDETEDKHV